MEGAVRSIDFAVSAFVIGLFAIFSVSIPPRAAWPNWMKAASAVLAGILTLAISATYHSMTGREMMADAIGVFERSVVCPVAALPHCPTTTPKTCIAGVTDVPVNIRVVAGLSGFGQDKVHELEKEIGCRNFVYSIGDESRFSGESMNTIAYDGALDYRIALKLLDGLDKVRVPIVHVCNHVGQIASGYILLAHYRPSDLASKMYTAFDLVRLKTSQSQEEFDRIAKSHPCNGSWPIRGPAARKAGS
jgi:hypothetical protein